MRITEKLFPIVLFHSSNFITFIYTSDSRRYMWEKYCKSDGKSELNYSIVKIQAMQLEVVKNKFTIFILVSSFKIKNYKAGFSAKDLSLFW